MTGSIIMFIAGVAAAFLPVLLWWYAFSYLDNSPLNARRFLVGLLAGGAAVVPILFFDSIGSIAFASPFSFIGTADHWLTKVASLSWGMLGIALSIIILSLGIFARSVAMAFSVVLKSSVFFLGMFLVVFLGLDIFFQITGFGSSILGQSSVVVAGRTLSAFSAVVLYYIIVSFTEEYAKHLSFLTSSYSAVERRTQWILFALFVALGFSLAENGLYLSHALSAGDSVWSMLVFRSVFSVLLHCVAVTFLASAFLRSLPAVQNPPYTLIRALLPGILAAVMLHTTFNVLLTAGINAVLVILFVVAYVVLTRAFYAGNPDEEGDDIQPQPNYAV